MTKPKAAKRTQEPRQNGSIPIEAVPHMFNRKMLEWQKVQFEALAEVHKVLTEIRDALKEK